MILVYKVKLWHKMKQVMPSPLRNDDSSKYLLWNECFFTEAAHGWRFGSKIIEVILLERFIYSHAASSKLFQHLRACSQSQDFRVNILEHTQTKLKLSWQQTSPGGSGLSWKETGSPKKEKKKEVGGLQGELEPRWWVSVERYLKKKKKDQQVWGGGVEERERVEGGGKGEQRGKEVCHRSCIVNVKSFSMQILFHCPAAERATRTDGQIHVTAGCHLIWSWKSAVSCNPTFPQAERPSKGTTV